MPSSGINAVYNGPMDVKQIRRTNALKLLKEKGINRSEFARRIGKTPQQVSVYLRDNPTRNIGHQVARDIENAFGLASGALDRDPHGDGSFAPPPPGNIVTQVRYASQCAKRYADAQTAWLQARRDTVRAIEDNFTERLQAAGLQITDVAAGFDFIVSNVRHQSRTISLFLPLPGFERWNPPLTESARPDILAIALLSDLSLDYAIIPGDRLPDGGNSDLAVDSTNGTIGGMDLAPYLNHFDLI